MKTPVAHILALSAACALAACSTEVTTDYDRAAPFGKYGTYTLAPPSGGLALSATSEAALRRALRIQLAKRGVTEAVGGKGDIAIVRHVFTQDRTSVQQSTQWGYGSGGGWPYGYGSYGMWGGAPVTYVDVNQYTEGTLVLDVVDTRTKKLVFRGTGTAVVGGAKSNVRKMEKAVEKMVAALPAKR